MLDFIFIYEWIKVVGMVVMGFVLGGVYVDLIFIVNYVISVDVIEVLIVYSLVVLVFYDVLK